MKKEVLNNKYIQINENIDLNGYEVSYLDKMNEDAISNIKMAGFKWSRRQQFWYAHKNDNTDNYIEKLKAEYEVQSENNKSFAYDEYIHSEEFISKFGDWEKANRIEKLKNSESIIGHDEIRVEGVDLKDLVNSLRENYSRENLKQLQAIARDTGRDIIEKLRQEQNINSPNPPVLKNIDSGKTLKIQMTGINEIKNHDVFKKGHIEAISSIPEIVQKAVYISTEPNEDGRKSQYTKFHYFGCGYTLNDEDYTAKVVFTETKDGELFYDQSLSSIEKGRLIDIIQRKNKPEAFDLANAEDSFGQNKILNPLISQENLELYDKRLINICQVPQMPYLEKVDGKWQPTKDAVEAVKKGTLYIEKTGQKYILHSPGNDRTASVSAEKVTWDMLSMEQKDAVIESFITGGHEGLYAAWGEYRKERNISDEFPTEEFTADYIRDSGEDFSDEYYTDPKYGLWAMIREEAEAKQITFSIYQVKEGSEFHGIRFQGLSNRKNSSVPSHDEYEKVYEGKFVRSEKEIPMACEEIFSNFNREDRPKDFTGRSMSVSDIILFEFEINGKKEKIACYCDPIGFISSIDDERLRNFATLATHESESFNPSEYVLNKLKEKGIEVVQDREEFNRILESETVLQRMTEINQSEKLFLTNNVRNLNSEIDNVTKRDINVSNVFIKISENTPFIYKEFGLEDYPVNIYKQKLARAFFLEKENFGERRTQGHKGEFSREDVKHVFETFGNPRYIFNSKENLKNPENFYLVGVYDVLDKLKNPMMLSLHFNKNNKLVEANWVTSIYGKNRNTLIYDWTEKGFLVYMNNRDIEKAPAEVVTLYMRVSKSASAYRNNIKLKSDIVNSMGISFYKTSDGTTYGFTHKGKIYLNPDVMTSEVVMHEYTHLWDNLTKRDNPELWNKGLEIFRGTSIWNEVINDENYQDIKDDEDLVLSECHARITGKVAEAVLNRIAELDGNEKQAEMIDWDKETIDFIYENYRDVFANNSFNSVTEFTSATMKDLFGHIEEQEIELSDLEQEQQAKDFILNKSKEITEEDISIAEKFIPQDQFISTLGMIAESEEKDHFKNKLIDIVEAVKNAPDIGETEGMEQHPVILRYFHPSGTESLICEISKDGREAFGYQVINGNYEFSEFGYLDLEEIKSIRMMEIDYYFPEGMTVEQWLNKKNIGLSEEQEIEVSNAARFSDLPIEELRKRIKYALNESAEILPEIEFTRENYNKLFPYSKIVTPIETVKIGVHQFEKLEDKDRKNLLQAVHDVLSTPDLIINEEKESVFGDTETAHVYAKSYVVNEKTKAVQSVVVNIEDENVSISTHKRDISNVVNKIKKPDQILFAAAKVRQLVERLANEKSVTVNPNRENEYVIPPQTSIHKEQEKSSDLSSKFPEYEKFKNIGLLDLEQEQQTKVFILQKFKEAGIEVVQDREEFKKRLEEIQGSDDFQAMMESFIDRNDNTVPRATPEIRSILEDALEKTAVPLTEIVYNRENYLQIFRDGIVQSPIETIKMGPNQFIRLCPPDRNNLMGAIYETMTRPSIVIEKETFDKKSERFKPVHVYGKSFINKENNHNRAVECLIIFRDGQNIASSLHNRDISKIVEQIKTADDIIYLDNEVSRAAAFSIQAGDSHVVKETEKFLSSSGRKSLPSWNKLYNPEEILSIKKLIEEGKVKEGSLEITKENFDKYFNIFNQNTRIYKGNKNKIVSDLFKHHVRPENKADMKEWLEAQGYTITKKTKKSRQLQISEGKVYGFTDGEKIYLNPDIFTSETAMHEYTHVWDKYIRETNPEIWNEGKKILSNTSLWTDIINDSNYADIADDEDLIMSECHARIVGKAASEILKSIAKRDGKLTADSVENWKDEVDAYIVKEFSNLDVKDRQIVSDLIKAPLKTFINADKITENSLDNVSPVSEVIYEENLPEKESTNESDQSNSLSTSESKNSGESNSGRDSENAVGSSIEGNTIQMGGDSRSRHSRDGHGNPVRTEMVKRGDSEFSSSNSSLSGGSVQVSEENGSNQSLGDYQQGNGKGTLDRVSSHDDSIDPIIDGTVKENTPLTPGEIKKTRAKIHDILSSKKDEEITKEELALISKYEGAGGLKEKNRTGNGVLNEFYTPDCIVEKVWQINDFYHPKGVSVLEPSCGSGRFASNRANNKFTMYEVDETSSRIARLVHPEAEVINQAFQEQFFDANKRFLNKDYILPKYDIVTGNPPYGLYSDKYRGLGEGKDFLRIEEYFISRGIDSLKDNDSILTMVVPSSFLNTREDKSKKILAEKGELIDAYRLPEKSFPTTDVGTDIVVFKKSTGNKENLERICSGNWFKEHPEKILGEIKIRINKYGRSEEYTSVHDGLTVLDELNKIPMLLDKEKELNNQIHTSRLTAKQKEILGRKKKGELLNSNEFSELYEKSYSADEYNLWSKTNWEGIVEIDRSEIKDPTILEENYIEIEKNRFTHKALFLSGDISEKIRDYEAKLSEERNTELIKLYEKNIQLLKDSLPIKTPFERIHFGVNTTFAENFEVDLINQDGYVEKINLQEAFIRWGQGFTLNKNEDPDRFIRGSINYGFSNILREDIPENIRWSDVIAYIDREPVRSERVSNYLSKRLSEDKKKELKSQNKKEAEEKRMARSETADKLFDKFIHTGLNEKYRKLIEKEYNYKFNNYVAPDYSKIPLFINGMSAYKGEKEFALYEQQIKGISFLSNKGNGLLAYDVGVGKTAAGIVATVSQLQLHRSKRPLVIVPNPVYSKWVNDFKELFPNIKINELYNLNSDVTEKYRKDAHTLDIPENSVSVVTYEALKNITFTDESCHNELFEDFSKLLSESLDADASDREIASAGLKIRNAIGIASKVKDATYYFFESAGFDHLTVDEAHHFKNLWVVPKSKNKGESNEYAGIPSGAVSQRALKLYGMTQLVQKKNNDRNVFLLTATPFTNSPLEVYSMLAYMGRKRLEKAGINSLRDFLDQFAQTKLETSVTPKGEIEYKQVMKNWKQLPALQKILTEFIDKVDGEEAGIVRPEKIIHVNQLEMTQLQKAMIEADINSMDEVKEGNPAAVLVAMNAMRLALVAPALADKTRYNNLNIQIPELKDLINTSPKLKFICQSVIDLYKENPEKGQFIYVPLGQESHTLIKDYLVKHGIPSDAVEIISGSVNNSTEKKEKVSQAFNDPTKKCKVLIGGKNTSEGIDLNGNSFVMYNCSIGWNPSETIQAEGRIWRQGNLQKKVHCVYPLMNDSIDALLYQKHDEKSSRINDLWSYKGDTLNVEDIKPEELKFDLIKDPLKKANHVIQEKTIEIVAEKERLNRRLNNYDEIVEMRIKTDNLIESKKRDIESYKKNFGTEPWAIENIKRMEKKELPSLLSKRKKITEKLEKMGIKTEEDEKKFLSEIRIKTEALDHKAEEIKDELPKLVSKFEKEQKIKNVLMPMEKQQKELVNDILSNIFTRDPNERFEKAETVKTTEKTETIETLPKPVVPEVKEKEEAKPLPPTSDTKKEKDTNLYLFDMDESLKANNIIPEKTVTPEQKQVAQKRIKTTVSIGR